MPNKRPTPPPPPAAAAAAVQQSKPKSVQSKSNSVTDDRDQFAPPVAVEKRKSPNDTVS